MTVIDNPVAGRMERRIARDVGRNVGPLAMAASGGLARAAAALEEATSVAILTGFYIPGAAKPAAETDGPIGAVFLAQAFQRRGVPVRMVTDAPCAPVIRVAMAAGGLGETCPLDVVAVPGFPDGETLSAVSARLDASHVIAIERCGPGVDGRPRNARGEDISAHTAELHRLFQPPAYCVGIGDGGNELGMGSLPLDVIANAIAHGERSACRTPADALIVAGVSNWAGAALALLLGAEIDGVAHDRLLEAICAAGAVDGITRLAAGTVDSVDPLIHRQMIDDLVGDLRSEAAA